MLFAAAFTAQRPKPGSDGQREFSILAWSVRAENLEQAAKAAHVHVLALWPPTNGWMDHHAFLTEVPQEFIDAEAGKA